MPWTMSSSGIPSLSGGNVYKSIKVQCFGDRAERGLKFLGDRIESFLFIDIFQRKVQNAPGLRSITSPGIDHATSPPRRKKNQHFSLFLSSCGSCFSVVKCLF